MLKRFTSSLLLGCFFNQTISSTAFAMLNDFEGVQNYLANGTLENQHTSLHFKADPANTAAGVLFYMRDPDGDYSVILGERDDDPGFCNFGGKSDSNDGTLNITAARESAEESMELFAIHPYLLSKSPFADLYSAEKNNKFYRMYLYQTEYINESHFNQKLSDATDSHSKEYKRFKMFKVNDLLGSINNKTKIIKTADKEEVSLYEPLFNMLSTPFYCDVLDRLAKLLSVPQKASYVREEDYTRHEDGKVSPRDKLAHDFQAIAINASNRAQSNADKARDDLRKLRKYGINLDGMKIVPNTYETVQFTAQEEKEFAYTEAFRQRVMMELKSNAEKKRIAALESPLILEKTEKFSVHSLRPKVDASRGRYTMTEGHLMLVLGHDYVEPTDFNDTAQHRLANIANLERYFKKYNAMEYKNKVAPDVDEEKVEKEKAEFKRELYINDRFINRLADVMDLERQEWIKTGRFPIYHGTTDQNGHAFRIASILNKHLTLKSTDHLTRLRYTDLYFRNTSNMAEDLAHFGDSHYENGNRDRRLFGNFILTAGLETTKSTSSSVEYWGNNHSVADPNVKKRFEEGTALLGMDLNYHYYGSLFQQFIADTGTAYNNGMLLQLFTSPEILMLYGATEYMDEKMALTAYQKAQAEYERISQNGKEDFSVDTQAKQGLFGEMRLLLHPDAMRDSNQLTTYDHDLFPLDAEKQKRFKNSFSAVTAANLGHWFAQKTALIPGSLMENPIARDLYKMVYKGVTGHELTDVPNTHSLLHLARFGHLEGLKTLIATCPDLLTSINPKDLCNAALESGSYAVTKYVVEEIIKKSINDIFDIKNILTKIDIFGLNKLKSSFNYVLEHYDFASIPKSDMPATVKQTLARIVLRTGDDYAIKLVNREIWSYTEEDIVEVVMPSNCNPDDWESRVAAVIHRGLMTIEKFTSLLLSYMKSAPASEQWFPQNQFIKLLKRGLNVSAINQSTGDPFLFDVPFFNNLAPEDEHFVYQGDFLSVRNQQGLNVLEHVLMEYKKGKVPLDEFTQVVDAYIKRTSFQLESYILPELYYFFKHKIDDNKNINFLNNKNPFALPGAQDWISKINDTLETDKYSTIKQFMEDCPSDDLLSYYVKKPTEILQQSITKISIENNNWREAMNKALLDNDKNEIKQIIDKMPTTNTYYYIEITDMNSVYNCEILKKPCMNYENINKSIKEWEDRLNEALDSDKYSDIKRVLSEVPYPNYTLQDQRLEILNKKEQSERQRADLKQTLVSEFDVDPLSFMSKIDTIDFSLFDSYFLDRLFKNEYATYTENILNQLFKDIAPANRAAAVLAPFADYNTLPPIIMKTITYSPSNLKVTREIFDWAGCAAVLEAMTENQVLNLLWNARDSDPELLNYIFDEASEVFYTVKPEKDLLRISSDYFSKKQVSKLARANISALKELDAMGMPRFLYLFDSYKDLLIELINENPTLLDFKTSLGLTLEELIANTSDDDIILPYLKKLLTMKQNCATK